ncbi:cytochrome c biogenesis CcdA family protein [Methanolobus bombayensis]|uniref:cytochrome c biogenesis CcdA family protein n=1 Tax=Methanolobus bombayensis TaxID=38023 RepID=UPI001AE682FF|nr:cytochrome c biogenesis CcdA family protein [Methanolobus bombayensis]MBP1907967.1 cytochrome c-type biogenesis protein [Methanolobus bombayensis]
MVDAGTLTPLASFFAGIVSVLSPCVLPLLPIVLAYSTGNSRLRPLAIIAGLTFSFTIMGIAASAFGEYFLPHLDGLRIVAELIIIFMGTSMLMEKDIFASLSQYTGKVHAEGNGLIGGIVIGVSLGIVWIPCVGPILASILTLVALEGNVFYGAGLLIIYSMGFAIPMLIIAYSAKISGDRLSKISEYDIELKKGAGVVLIIVGLWMVYTNHIAAYVV